MEKEEFKKYIESMREKKQLHAMDVEQNRQIMKMMNKIRTFSVFEKHLKKSNYVKQIQEQRYAGAGKWSGK